MGGTLQLHVGCSEWPACVRIRRPTRGHYHVQLVPVQRRPRWRLASAGAHGPWQLALVPSAGKPNVRWSVPFRGREVWGRWRQCPVVRRLARRLTFRILPLVADKIATRGPGVSPPALAGCRDSAFPSPAIGGGANGREGGRWVDGAVCRMCIGVSGHSLNGVHTEPGDLRGCLG